MKGKLKISRSICNMDVIQWIRTVVIFSSVCVLVFFSFLFCFYNLIPAVGL
jgi:hypothetical protein